MDKIEIGEFVRTKSNGIKRIDTIFENKTVNKYGYKIDSDWDGEEYGIIKTIDIVKHSGNLIDLIEVGDVVVSDGMKFEVLESFCKEINTETLGIKYYNQFTMIEEVPIESILTKEQYMQNCYVVEKE